MILDKITEESTRAWQSDELQQVSIDLILLDRPTAHQEAVASRRISLHGEYSIIAHCGEPNKVISGNADYALGYEPGFLETKPRLESSMVIVETKKKITFETC